MSKCLNEVTLLGYVGKNPETKALQNGNLVVSFSLATNKSWRDKVTGETKSKTEWHRIVRYQKFAEGVSKYIHSGDRLLVRGELTYRKWKGKDDIERTTVEILGNEVFLLGGKGGEKDLQELPREMHSSEHGEELSAPAVDDFNDDIPF